MSQSTNYMISLILIIPLNGSKESQHEWVCVHEQDASPGSFGDTCGYRIDYNCCSFVKKSVKIIGCLHHAIAVPL